MQKMCERESIVPDLQANGVANSEEAIHENNAQETHNDALSPSSTPRLLVEGTVSQHTHLWVHGAQRTKVRMDMNVYLPSSLQQSKKQRAYLQHSQQLS